MVEFVFQLLFVWWWVVFKVGSNLLVVDGGGFMFVYVWGLVDFVVYSQVQGWELVLVFLGVVVVGCVLLCVCVLFVGDLVECQVLVVFGQVLMIVLWQLLLS